MASATSPDAVAAEPTPKQPEASSVTVADASSPVSSAAKPESDAVPALPSPASMTSPLPAERRDLGEIVSALGRILAADAPILAPGGAVLARAGTAISAAEKVDADVRAELGRPPANAADVDLNASRAAALRRVAEAVAQDAPGLAENELLRRLGQYTSALEKLGVDMRGALGPDADALAALAKDAPALSAIHSALDAEKGNLGSALHLDRADADKISADVRAAVARVGEHPANVMKTTDEALARSGETLHRLAGVLHADAPGAAQAAGALARVGGLLSGAGKLEHDLRTEISGSREVPGPAGNLPTPGTERPPSGPSEESGLARHGETLHRLAGVLHADAPSAAGAADALARAGALADGAGRLQTDVMHALGVDERDKAALLAAGMGALAHGRDALAHLFHRHADAGEPGSRLTSFFSHGHGHTGEARLASAAEHPAALAPVKQHNAHPEPELRPAQIQLSSRVPAVTRVSYADSDRALPALPSPAQTHTAPRSSSSHRDGARARSDSPNDARVRLSHDLPGAQDLGRAGMQMPARAFSDGGRAHAPPGDDRRPVSWGGDDASSAPAPRRSRHRSAVAAFGGGGGGGGGDPPGPDGGYLHLIPEGEPEKKTDKRLTVSKRLEDTIEEADKERKKAKRKAVRNSYALNIAIGSQVLLGALTTGLGASLSGRGSSTAISILGGAATLVASYLAKARSSGEPEASATRVKVLEHFLREVRAFSLDHCDSEGYDEQVHMFRTELEILLGKIKAPGQGEKSFVDNGAQGFGAQGFAGSPGLGAQGYGAQGLGTPAYSPHPGFGGGLGAFGGGPGIAQTGAGLHGGGIGGALQNAFGAAFGHHRGMGESGVPGSFAPAPQVEQLPLFYGPGGGAVRPTGEAAAYYAQSPGLGTFAQAGAGMPPPPPFNGAQAAGVYAPPPFAAPGAGLAAPVQVPPLARMQTAPAVVGLSAPQTVMTGGVGPTQPVPPMTRAQTGPPDVGTH